MNTTVAGTILEQLGGAKLIAMTGAHSFTAGRDCLTFKLPGTAKNQIRGVRITLTPLDEYTMEFFAFRGSFKTGDYRFEVVAKHEGLYCDQLQTVFEDETGLLTKLF